MSKINKGEVGFKTTLIHDTLNNQFAEKKQYLLINRIEIYHNFQTIFGFFAFYNDDTINKSIFKSSYYTQFTEQFDQLKKTAIEKDFEVKHDTLLFTKAEALTQIKLIYDENEHKIKAIKFNKGNKIYSYGNNALFNKSKKDVNVLFKMDNFITGFATCYLKEGNIPYLSYIRAHFEKEDNFSLYYYEQKKPSQVPKIIRKAYKRTASLLMFILKAFIVLWVIVFPFAVYYYTAQNIYSGKVYAPHESIKESVKIFTDENGFTHIKANSTLDGYFALGFEHAKSRLWTMDRTRRTARGRLSEIFGQRTVDIDIAIRGFGLNELAERSASFVKTNSAYLKEMMAYIDGINFYANNYILPIEYHSLRTQWVNWELSDSIAVMNLYSFGLGHDWNMELWYKTMEETMGKEFADYVLSFRDLNYPFANETIVSDEELMEMGMNVNWRKSDEVIQKERSNIGKEVVQGKEKDNVEKEKKLDNQYKKLNEKVENKENEPNKKKEKDEIKPTENKTIKTNVKETKTSAEKIKPTEPNTVKAKETKLTEKKLKEDKPTESESTANKPKINAKDTSNKEEQTSHNNSKSQKEAKESIKDKQIKTETKATEDHLTGPFQSEGASNCWVLSGNLTSSDKPLLSNDPHLPNSMPSLFFIAKLYLPTETITGSTLPGIPFFTTGSNTQISWGLTTENSDNTDICEEKIENDFYIYNNKKYPLTITTEDINIKNSQAITLKVKWTRNGPILPSVIPKQLIVLNTPFKSDTPLSFRSAMYFFDFNNFDFYFKMNFAKSSKDFLPFVDMQSTPNYNFHWASTNGEIGWVPLGKISIKNYSNRFCRGYTSEDDVIKYIPRIEIPKLISPKKGFIVTANNKLASFNYQYHLHGHHNHIRAYRIREMIEKKLNNNTKITVNDTMTMINDIKESLAEYILPKLLAIVQRNHIDPIALSYYKNLSEWNFIMDPESFVPTIYSIFERAIGRGLLTNKIDDVNTAYSIMNYLHYWNFISGMIDKIYQGERIDLKQCIHDSGNINCEKYIMHIFNKLDRMMTEEGFKNRDGSIKKWGSLIFNSMEHQPFDKVPFIGERLFSRRVYTGGNRNTVKIARHPYNHFKGPFTSTQSANLKFICDMAEPTKPYIVIPGGNSGSVLSSYYDNLVDKHEQAQLIQINNVHFDDISNDNDNTNQLIIIEKSIDEQYYTDEQK